MLKEQRNGQGCLQPYTGFRSIAGSEDSCRRGWTGGRIFQMALSGVIGLLCVFLGTGCTAMVGGAIIGVGETAALTYWHGERSGYVDAPCWKCEQAVAEVARRYRLREIQHCESGTTTTFKLRNFENVPFRIRLEPLAGDSTRVSIRAGVWGDEVCSSKLLSEIRRSVTVTSPARER